MVLTLEKYRHEVEIADPVKAILDNDLLINGDEIRSFKTVIFYKWFYARYFTFWF